MIKFNPPQIELLLFDEEEISAAASNTYAAKELNNYMFGEGIDSAGTTTITLERAVGK